jgi:hypothetical protein
MAEVDPDSIGEALLERAVDTCRKVVALLEERSDPREAEGFRTFLADVALGVANAAGGGFLDGGGVRFSRAEHAAVDAIRDALALGPLAERADAGTPGTPAEPPRPDTVRGVTGIPEGPIDPE